MIGGKYMSKHYVVSTLTASQAYTLFEKADEDGKRIPRAKRVVVVKGGHGVSDKNLITPQGVVTTIDEDQANFLENNDAFKRHEKAGFVKILKKNPGDSEKSSSDLEQRDGSSPLNPGDFEAKGKKPPKVGANVTVK